jgi:hypothetical protein
MNRQAHRLLRAERLEDRWMLSGVPGDFDASGTVDAADYTTWRDDLGSETALVNDDGLGTPIGQAHYQLWKDNFGNSAVAESGPYAMLALHLDPNNSVGEIENATPENWGKLEEIVAAADFYLHKLTLLMSSSWVDLVDGTLDGVNRIDEVKSWIDFGHQLGYHHHSCGHNHPDGYRDVPDDSCEGEEDRGSVEDSFGDVYALGETLITMGVDPDLARVEIAAQGPNDNNEYRSEEWQPEAIYATGRVDDNSDGHAAHRFITLPRCTEDYGNNYGTGAAVYEVAELGHAQLNVGDFVDSQSGNNLTWLEMEINRVLTGDHADSGVHIGVVFHAREYTENDRDAEWDDYASDKEYLDAVFGLFAEKGLPVVTAREILQASNPCDR